MTIKDKHELERHVSMAVQEYGIHVVLFRNAIASSIGVNVTDAECLGFLFHQKQATPKELARYTGLTSGSTTAMLDRLEKAKLIKRQPNPRDRRGTLITISDTGAKEIAPYFLELSNAQDNLIAGYPEEELWVLAEFFQKFTALYEQE
jgi:DNA-binding MarR family transcriptional regulator